MNFAGAYHKAAMHFSRKIPNSGLMQKKIRREIKQQSFLISGVRLFAYGLYANSPNTEYSNGCRLIFRQILSEYSYSATLFLYL